MDERDQHGSRFLDGFRELSYGNPDGPSLCSALRERAGEDDSLVVSYLRAGTVLAVSGSGMARDVLSPQAEPIERLVLLTDGHWLWHSGLDYFVERYHLRLDERFVEHVRVLQGVPPAVDETRLFELEQELLSIERRPQESRSLARPRGDPYAE
ncbi:hypothetical protein ACQEU3_37485 [Spirillospora sp. CA-253888]